MSYRLPLALLALAPLGASCGDRSVEPDPRTTPAELRVAMSEQRQALLVGTVMRVPVQLLSRTGDTLPMPPGLVLRSRAPDVVAVDSGTTVVARAVGTTWIVASLPTTSGVLADSLEIAAMCTGELNNVITPRERTIAVGESFTATASVTTCGGRVPVADTFRWSVLSGPPIVAVDSLAGRITGLEPGETVVLARGERAGYVGTVRVTVTPRAP